MYKFYFDADGYNLSEGVYVHSTTNHFCYVSESRLSGKIHDITEGCTFDVSEIGKGLIRLDISREHSLALLGLMRRQPDLRGDVRRRIVLPEGVSDEASLKDLAESEFLYKCVVQGLAA